MRDEADKGLPPWIQYYNRLKGEPKLGPFDQHLSEPESLNVKMIGKWGRGPAARVTGRDTLVYLALGSEVAVFNCVNARTPVIVNEIQCRYVVDRPILEDSILYCVLQGGIEVFNIANPASPTRIKYLPISAVDMCINDTMAYTIDADSFKAYRIIAPDSFERLGACADSGYYIAADSGFAYLCDRWGLYVIDATDPTNPQQVSIVSGAQTGAVWVDSGYCYYTTVSASPNSFRIADVSDPYHPAEVGYADSVASYDLYKLSYFVYLPGFYIVDVSTPSFPTEVGSTTYGGNGVWTRSPFSYSFIAADYNGFATINITDPVHPVVDSVMAGAHESYDVSVGNSLAYVANSYAGLKIIDVANARSPIQVGSYDTVGHDPYSNAVSARDSFAYLMAGVDLPTAFRVLSVSDPTNPSLAGSCRVYDPGEAVALRDTLAYVAEAGKLEIFSIANPRAPRLVGSLGFSEGPASVCVKDSIAYLTCGYSGLKLVNVADPSNPTVIGSCAGSMNATGVAVQDTVAYVASFQYGLQTVSVANPQNPYLLATLPISGEYSYDVVVRGNRAFVGAFALHLIDVSDPAQPAEIGFYPTPSEVHRLFWDQTYVYAACFEAGVCIFDTALTSVGEQKRGVSREAGTRITCWPNPAESYAVVHLEGAGRGNSILALYDPSGRRLIAKSVSASDSGALRFDLTACPRGVYFLTWRSGDVAARVKLVVD
jgi:hypothetical protein